MVAVPALLNFSFIEKVETYLCIHSQVSQTILLFATVMPAIKINPN